MTEPFTIAADGDEDEMRWWPPWTCDRFPAYETFWAARIVPLTYRVKERRNIRFQTAAELAAAGYGDEDVAVAQLHYTLLGHLGRVFELLDDARAFTEPAPASRGFGRDKFFESLTRLSGASDVADELLERRANPNVYDPWDERDGMKARGEWRSKGGETLRPVRAYRNRLVHGRVVPETYMSTVLPDGRPVGQLLLYPRLDKVDSYLDWRVAFAAVAAATAQPPDFDDAALIAREAWEMVVDYVEQAWRTHLLPNI